MRDDTVKTSLPRVLGTVEAVTIVVGSVIGSGIFFKPQTIAAELGSFGLVLFVWVVCGGLSVLGALTYAELGTMMPHAGGQYVYLREAYGRLWAFLWGWTELLVARTGACAALAVAFALSLNQIVPLSAWAAKLTAVLTIVLLTAVNVWGTRKGSQVQNVTTYIKAGFLALIALLPFVLGRAHGANWSSSIPSRADSSLLPAFGAAMIAALWAYDGWGNLTPVAEEVEAPQRTIPRALLAGVLIVAALYITANVAYHAVLPIQKIAKSSHVAADVLQSLWGDWGKKALAAYVMCSTFGGVNANLLIGPRVFFAMARDGVFFAPLREVHPRHQTPANAIVLQGVWAIALLMAGGLFKSGKELLDLFNTLTDFVIFGASIFYTMAVAAVFVLRRKFPDKPRPYRTWGYPIVPLIFVLVYLWLLTTTLLAEPKRSGLGLALIALGVPMFWYWERRGRMDKANRAVI